MKKRPFKSEVWRKYRYEGPVYDVSGRCIERDYISETGAISKEKALSNIQFRYKVLRQMSKYAYISLDENCLTVLDERPEQLKLF